MCAAPAFFISFLLVWSALGRSWSSEEEKVKKAFHNFGLHCFEQHDCERCASLFSSQMENVDVMALGISLGHAVGDDLVDTHREKQHLRHHKRSGAQEYVFEACLSHQKRDAEQKVSSVLFTNTSGVSTNEVLALTTLYKVPQGIGHTKPTTVLSVDGNNVLRSLYSAATSKLNEQTILHDAQEFVKHAKKTFRQMHRSEDIPICSATKSAFYVKVDSTGHITKMRQMNFHEKSDHQALVPSSGASNSSTSFDHQNRVLSSAYADILAFWKSLLDGSCTAAVKFVSDAFEGMFSYFGYPAFFLPNLSFEEDEEPPNVEIPPEDFIRQRAILNGAAWSEEKEKMFDRQFPLAIDRSSLLLSCQAAKVARVFGYQPQTNISDMFIGDEGHKGVAAMSIRKLKPVEATKRRKTKHHRNEFKEDDVIDALKGKKKEMDSAVEVLLEMVKRVYRQAEASIKNVVKLGKQQIVPFLDNLSKDSEDNAKMLKEISRNVSQIFDEGGLQVESTLKTLNKEFVHTVSQTEKKLDSEFEHLIKKLRKHGNATELETLKVLNSAKKQLYREVESFYRFLESGLEDYDSDTLSAIKEFKQNVKQKVAHLTKILWEDVLGSNVPIFERIGQRSAANVEFALQGRNDDADVMQAKEWNALDEEVVSLLSYFEISADDGKISKMSNFISHKHSTDFLDARLLGWHPSVAATPVGVSALTALLVVLPVFLGVFLMKRYFERLIKANRDDSVVQVAQTSSDSDYHVIT